MDRELIGRVAHEINRAYCAAQGDDSQPSWDSAPDWQKQSTLAGVDMHLANPNATPEDSHAAWLAIKLADGWAYGEVKDPEAKLHPCVLPYDELPIEQRAKDHLFKAVVAQMASLPAPVAPSDEMAVRTGYVAVTYIGARPVWRDTLYGSGLIFAARQTRVIPSELAHKFLRHRDVFTPAATVDVPADQDGPVATDDTAELLAKTEQQKQEQETAQQQITEIRDALDQMSNAALREFIEVKYDMKIKGQPNKAALHAQATQLLDQYGPR